MRLDKLTTLLQQALGDAQSLALAADHPYIEPVHLLKALLQQEDGPRSLLQRAGVSLRALDEAIDAALARIASVTGAQVQPGRDLMALLQSAEKQEGGTAAERCLSADAHLTGGFAVLGGVQHPSQGTQQRRLSAAARPGEQHPLPRLQAQVDISQHRCPRTQGRPGQPAHQHGCRAAPGHRRSLRAACSAPGPNASRAPARAKARTSAWPPRPASSTPESTEKPSTATFQGQAYSAA